MSRLQQAASRPCTSRLLQDVQAAEKVSAIRYTAATQPSGGHTTLTVPDRIYDLVTCTAEDLAIGFAHRVPFTINGFDAGIIQSLSHEDGSGYSYLVHCNGQRFYLRILPGFDTNRLIGLPERSAS